MPHRSHLRGLHGIALIATYLAACGDESPGSPTGADGAEDVSLISDATPGVDSADPRDAGPEDISETNAAADTGGERCLARVDAGDETLDLGLAVPGFPATSFVQIANTCTYALTVAPPTVLDPETGSDAGLFAASLTRDDGLAVEGQLVAGPGERFVVWVWMAFDDTRYSAEAPTHRGVIQVSATGGERVEVPVSASMRAESCLVANPASISFGTLVLGDTGVATVALENVCDQRIELRSTETNAASLVSARLEGGSAEILDGLHPLFHSLAPHERVDARFSWTPEEVSEQPFVERAFRFISSLGAVDLEVSGACALGPCRGARIGGAAGTVPAGQPVTLDAGGSVEGEGGAIVAWSWTLVAPEISASTLNNDDTDSLTFTPDVSGLDTVTLRVTDASGIESCAPGSLALTVSGEPVEIVVTLTWSTPSGVEHPAGAPAPDPNLHLAHPDAGQFDLWGDAALEPWYDVTHDAFYFTSGALDWGEPGVGADNPRLGIDQSGPSGFEDVALTTSEPWRTYRIGVDRYRRPTESAQPAPVRPTVTIRIDGTTVATFSGGDLLPGDFWELATVTPATGNVGTLDTVYHDIDTGTHFER